MKSSEILRKAARELEADPRISWVDRVTGARGMKIMRDRLYCPATQLHLMGWTAEEQIIALCLAAAIAESEGD